LNEFISKGFHIIYADEMMVTKSSIPTHAYSRKNERIKIDYWQYRSKPIAALAGVSEQLGTDLVMLFDYSVNKKKFKVYLDELRARYFFDDICIYMDNLSVHRSIEIRERMDELGIAYIFSPIYSPDLNPVEYVFSMVKKQIKAERLNAIVNEQEIDLYSVI